MADELGTLRAENARLRERVRLAERSTAETLARATRLSQVISVLGRDTGFDAAVASASREVAELYHADVGVLMLGGPGRLRVRGTWGVRDADVPPAIFPFPALRRLADSRTVAVGPVEELPVPAWLDRYRVRHVALTRLLAGAHPLGVLLLGRRAEHPFLPADGDELRAIGHRIALALENGDLHDQMRRQVVQLSHLGVLTTRLAGELEPAAVGRLVVEALVRDAGVASCRVEALRGGVATTVAAGGAEEPDEAAWQRRPLQTSNGAVGTVWVAGVPAATDRRELLGQVVGVAALALDKALLYERSRDQARLDSLTGLLGHRVFQEEMRRRTTGDAPFSVVRLDIDDFKQVNDLCGHGVGDEALRLVADALRRGVREEDQVFRVGGEEFCVILHGLAADDDAALRIAERLREAVSVIDLALPLTISLGLAGFPLHARDRDRLLELADVALYASKRAGKNRTTLAGAGARAAGATGHTHANPLVALHERDPETVAHSLHVARLAVGVARRLGLPDDRLDDLRVAAPPHDVGKVGVPAAVLAKPGPLTEAETLVVRTHPLVGAELLRGWGLEAAARFVGEHHERLDGGGYPAGLAGEAIALESRIICAADAFVAMTLDRPYRAALDPGAAVAELHRCAGTQFDPAVVAALVAEADVPAGAAVPAL